MTSSRQSITTFLVVSALAAGLTLAAPPPPVQAATPRPTNKTCPTQRPDEASALAAARLCGRAVEVSAATSELTRTWANPDGTLTTEQHVRPARIRQDGTWVPTTAVLRKKTDGSIVPMAAAMDYTFSGGGDQPLVSAKHQGADLTLRSPFGKLPTPTLDGNIATYAEVLPGVDLQLIAGVDGFAEQLVVKNATAAANPALRKFQFGLSLGNASMKTDGSSVKVVNNKGEPLFSASPANMWDSGDQATKRPIRAQFRANALELAPDMSALAHSKAKYPLVLDPGFTSYRYDWNEVNSAQPDVTYYNTGDAVLVGTPDAGASKWRSFWNMDLSAIGTHRQIVSASFKVRKLIGLGCDARAVELHRTAWVPNNTTWNNQPASNLLIGTRTTSEGYNSSCPATEIGWDVASALQNVQDLGQTSVSFMMKAGSETDTSYRKYLDANPYIAINYNPLPSVIGRATSPSTACVTGSNRPFVNTTQPQLKVTVADPGNEPVKARIEIKAVGGSNVAVIATGNTASGGTVIATPATGKLVNGGNYAWRAAADDGKTSSADGVYLQSWSTWCEFTVDTTTPNALPAVSSSDYPSGQWSKTAGAAGVFSLSAGGVADVASYLYGLDTNPPTTTVTASSLGGGSSVTIAPASDGPHVLYVQSVDRAGNKSALQSYSFFVGAAATLSPRAGDVIADLTVLQGQAPAGASGATFQWRRSDNDTWTDIPVGDVTLAAGGGAVSWPVSVSTDGTSVKLNWNVKATLAAANAGVALDGPVQTRSVFGGGISSAVKFNVDQDRATAAAVSAGPGRVNLQTGAFTVMASDVAVGGAGLARSYNTRDRDAVDPMFGPGWVSSLNIGQGHNTYTGITVTGSLAQIGLTDGTTVGFTRSADGNSWDAPTGVTLKLTFAASKFTLTTIDGATTEFAAAPGGPTGAYVPTAAHAAGSQESATYSWERVNGVVRPTQLLSPVPAGVSCASGLIRGCRALAFTYNQSGRLAEVAYTGWAPDISAMATTTVARYAYDASGRLQETWDPRLDWTDAGVLKHLSTGYAYDADGVLNSLSPPGEAAWSFGYTTVPGDNGKGRLAQVSRTGTAPTTLVYRVPVTGAGAPADLSATQTVQWGQTEAPVAATAVFGNGQTPDGSQPAGTMPSSWERAAVNYMDASGRGVNLLTPGGGLSAQWYDRYGNVYRQMTAGGRRAVLNGETTPVAASSWREFSADGRVMLRELTPYREIVLQDGSTVTAPIATDYVYDEGAPVSSEPFRLATTQRASVQVWDGAKFVSVDTRTTATGYNWTSRMPTSSTVDPGGLALTTQTAYDAAGRTTSTTSPSGLVSTTVYYSAGANGAHPECGNRPEWTDLVCRTQSGANGTATVTTYDRFGSKKTVQDSTSAGVQRTVTMEFDQASRMQSATTSGLGVALETRYLVYDPATGRPVTSQTRDAAGNITAQITRTYDALGRLSSYTDADGNVTTTTYDTMSRPATVNDGKYLRTNTYDGGTERRGLLTKVTDGQGGDINGVYNVDGELTGQTWANGLTMTKKRDISGTTSGLAYTKPGCGQSDCTLFQESSGLNAHGQVVRHSSTLSSQTFGYDQAGRLTSVADSASGECRTRVYSFDNATNRTGLTNYGPAANGACQTQTPASTTTWTYDGSDRVTNAGYQYDALGRTLRTPAADTSKPGDGDSQSTYFVNDMVRTISQGNRQTEYSVDVVTSRFRSWTETVGSTSVTKRHHYGNDSDKPLWTDEGNNKTTRILGGITGVAGIYSSTTGITWQVANLHGDLVAGISSDGTAILYTSDYTEHGQTRNAADSGTRRYGWQGSSQRSADTPDGSILMGARQYNPATGRFGSTDPIFGGNANAYEYCSGDPINCSDTSGAFSCRASWRGGWSAWWGRFRHGGISCNIEHGEIYWGITWGTVWSMIWQAGGVILAPFTVGVSLALTLIGIAYNIFWYLVDRTYGYWCNGNGAWLSFYVYHYQTWPWGNWGWGWLSGWGCR